MYQYVQIAGHQQAVLHERENNGYAQSAKKALSLRLFTKVGVFCVVITAPRFHLSGATKENWSTPLHVHNTNQVFRVLLTQNFPQFAE